MKSKIPALVFVALLVMGFLIIPNTEAGNTGVNTNLNGIAWNPNGSYAFAVGDKDSSNQYGTVVKYDGTWKKQTLTAGSGSKTDFNAVSFKSDGTAYIVGDSGRVVKFNGADAFQKVNQDKTTEDLMGIAWNSNSTTAIIVGDKGTILKYDGSQFTDLTDKNLDRDLKSVAWKNGYAIIVGSEGTVLKTDGTTVEKLNAGTIKELKDISFRNDGNIGLIVGYKVVIKYTPASNKFDILKNAPAIKWRGVAWISGDEAILVGEKGKVYKYSEPKGTFSLIKSGTNKDFNDVALCRGYVLAVGASGEGFRINTSPITTMSVGSPNFGTEPINASQRAKFTLTADRVATSGNITTYYKIDNGSWSSSTSSSRTNISFNISELGEHNITYYSEDGSGKETENVLWVNIYKTGPPLTTLSIIGPQFDINSIYVKSSTIFRLTPTDKGEGIGEVIYWIDNDKYETPEYPVDFSISYSGNHTIRYYSTNSAGDNVEPAHIISVFVDDSSPTTTNNYDNRWKNSDFTIELNSTDECGVSDIYYKLNGGIQKSVEIDGDPIIDVEDDNNTLEYFAVDNLGNVESIKILSGIKLDKTKPIANITAFIMGEDNAEYPLTDKIGGIVAFKGNVIDEYLEKRYLSWSSNGTNWTRLNEYDSNVYNSTLDYWNTSSNADGSYYIKLTAIDKAGNIAEYHLTVEIDNTQVTIRNDDIVLPVFKALRGQTITITVYIRNTGSFHTGWIDIYFYDIYVKDGYMNESIIGNVFISEGLNPGKSRPVSIDYTIPHASEHTIKVEVKTQYSSGVDVSNASMVFQVVNTVDPSGISASSFDVNIVSIISVVFLIAITYIIARRRKIK